MITPRRAAVQLTNDFEEMFMLWPYSALSDTSVKERLRVFSVRETEQKGQLENCMDI